MKEEAGKIRVEDSKPHCDEVWLRESSEGRAVTNSTMCIHMRSTAHET